MNKVDFSYNLRRVGKYAFAGCRYLKKAYFSGEELAHIDDAAFFGCGNLSVSLDRCEKLQTIGQLAFNNVTKVSVFTPSQVLTSVGSGAFSDLKVKTLELPNSLTAIESQAFCGTFSTIRIGNGVTYIADNGFVSTASSGEMYVNMGTPPTTDGDVIANGTGFSGAESKWTLYVPVGCKSAYSKKSPWNKFKSIVEDSSLDGSESTGNEDEEDRNTINGYEYVDLGLSVKWATYNIGASSPEEFGDYFAWGETTPSDENTPDWEDYEHCDGDMESCNDIGADISGTKYDAATKILGKGWRMPTLEEWKELKSECNYEWTDVNGVDGLKVIGPNGNSMFLPAGGDMGWLGHDDENRGNYWTSIHDYDSEIYKAECVRFYYYNNSVSFSVPFSQKGLRSNCKSIRAVTD